MGFVRSRSIQKRRERGSALITALALVAVCTISMTGVCILASSHAVRERREADYSLAMQLAEAGINYELRYVSTHTSTSPYAHLSGSAYAGSITGITGTFSVYVTKTDGTTGWTPGNDMKVISTGTVGNISRTVTIIAKSGGGAGTPIFDSTFAVFGYQSILFTQSSNAISGNMGVNGPTPASSAYSIGTSNNGVGNANSASAKPLVLCGGATLMPGNSVNPNFTNNPTKIDQRADNISWPTVDTIVAATFASGWTTLSSSTSIAAQWGRMKTFKTQSRLLTAAGTKAVTFTAGSTVLNDTVVKTKADDGQWVNALILPPGDYYFTSLQLNRNNGYSGPAPVIYFDTNASTTGGTPGPVRLWIGGTSTASDIIDMDFQYTSTLDSDKAKLSRIFYSKPANFTITGNNNFAGVYAIRKGASTGVSPATITLTQNSKITGAVISDNVVMTGGANVISPTVAMTNSSDYAFGGSGGGSYGFSGSWKEVSATGGTVFSDGTNR